MHFAKIIRNLSYPDLTDLNLSIVGGIFCTFLKNLLDACCSASGVNKFPVLINCNEEY